MGAEYEFLGNKIVQLGVHYYVGYLKGTHKKVYGESLNDVKDKIMANLHQLEKEELYSRINGALGCNRDTFIFFYNMVVNLHSCEGAAIQRMQDYCDAKNI